MPDTSFDKSLNPESPAAAADDRGTGSASDIAKANEKSGRKSFGEIGRKIRSRTSDLLAIAIVIVGGIAVGSRVSGWWGEEPADESNPTKAAAAVGGTPNVGFDEKNPLQLDFGESSHTLQRTVVSGDRKLATEQLLTACRTTAERTRLPSQGPSTGERRLLQLLAKAKPVAEDKSGRRLFHIDGPVAMASVTGPAKSESSQQTDASASRRVICWGLTFPAGKDRWIQYLFTPAGEKTAGTQPAVDVPLPPNSRLILSIRGGDNTRTTSFQLQDTRQAAWEFYKSWFQQNGWSETHVNKRTGTAAFEKEIKNQRYRAEIQLSPTGTGVLTVRSVVAR